MEPKQGRKTAAMGTLSAPRDAPGSSDGPVAGLG